MLSPSIKNCLRIFCIIYGLEPVLGNCFININTLQEHSPIFLKNNRILNSGTNFIEIAEQESIDLLCSGTNNEIINVGQNLATITCKNGEFSFNHNNEMVEVSQARCRFMPKSRAKHYGTCNSDGTVIEIGFDITNHQFLPCIQVCFNEEKAQTYWTKHYLKSEGYYWKQKSYTPFESDFFRTDIQPYSVYRQHRNIVDKGHLSPRGDFYTSAEKRMTHYFINVAPQAKRFNHENWRKLEEAIRRYSQNTKKNFHVYTGTHGEQQCLYKDCMPLALYFWKVIIEENTGKGVAFLGTNDVENQHPKLCGDICHQMEWLGQFQDERHNWRDGQVYCCQIESFESLSSIKTPTFREYKGKGVV